MAQFTFQDAILKIRAKEMGASFGARFSFAVSLPLSMLKPRTPAAPAQLSALRRQITDLVARNAVAMVQHAIDAVNEEGQYQAIKYLFEMVGLYPALAGDETPAEDSLVKTLLHHLGLPELVLSEKSQKGKTSTATDPLK